MVSMRRDLRPFWVKQVYLKFRSLWVWWFLAPRCELLGEHSTIMSPWFVIISGPNIRIGHSFTAIGEIHYPVQIGVWGRNFGEGRVELGSACLMSPGARISASDEVVLGNGCMMAHGSYITDSDWHGLYDRVNRDAVAKPVRLGDNVWLGDRSTVLKGVTIGENSIVAASSVVTKDVPANVIVAGNPAVVVRQLDADEPRYTREDMFCDPSETQAYFKALDQSLLAQNSFWRWCLYAVFPRSRPEQ
jgi:acetyltransferase-like isoleucine patch superfamily enzyme